MKSIKFNKPSSSQKTIFLHIGVPKTGSSTIQKGLYHNQKRLRRNGFLYPRSGLIGTNHKNIFFQLTSMEDHRAKYTPGAGNLEELAKEISETRFNKIMISAEHFALFNSSQIKTLQNALNPFLTKVIVYLRRQDQVIQSGWSQNAKRLVTKKSLDQNIDEEISTNKSVYHYDYLLKKWAKAFGKENLILRIFEPDNLSGHIFHDFLKTCGIESPDKFPIPISTNVSPGYRTLGLIQEISNRIDFENIDPITRVQIGKEIERYCDQLGWDKDEKFNAIDEPTFNRIMTHFRPGNKKVAQEYLGKDELFSESFTKKEVTHFKLDQIEKNELLAIFSHLINTFQISIRDKKSLSP